MPARRLVRLIEKNSEQLARELSEKVWNSPRCSDLRKVPADELQARTREIYQNLNNWLMDLTEAEVEQRYTELGARRAAQGVADVGLDGDAGLHVPTRIRDGTEDGGGRAELSRSSGEQQEAETGGEGNRGCPPENQRSHSHSLHHAGLGRPPSRVRRRLFRRTT